MVHDIFSIWEIVKVLKTNQILDGLGGEKTRWSDGAAMLADKLHNIIGDVLIGAAVVAYLGPFTVDFRQVRKNYVHGY